MAEVQVANITPDLLRVNIPSLSYLGLINIATTFSLTKFWYQEKKEAYFQNDFVIRHRYFELTDKLLHQSCMLEVPGLAPLARLLQFEFIIEADYWSLFLNKLAQHELLELRNIAEKLATETNTPIKTEFIPSSFATSTTSAIEATVSLIDIDHSMENKLIFYYLFQANIESIEKIAGKIDLMTLEQKELFIEQIFQKSPLQKLPKIIYTRPFCTLKITTSPLELLPLIKSSKIKVLMKRPSFPSLNWLPEDIKSSKHYPEIINLIEETRAFYEETRNYYLLPLMLRQTALLELDLQSLEELQKIAGPLTESITNLINKQAPFTKGFSKN